METEQRGLRRQDGRLAEFARRVIDDIFQILDLCACYWA